LTLFKISCIFLIDRTSVGHIDIGAAKTSKRHTVGKRAMSMGWKTSYKQELLNLLRQLPAKTGRIPSVIGLKWDY